MHDARGERLGDVQQDPVAARLDPTAAVLLDLTSPDRRVEGREGLILHVVRTDHSSRNPVW